MTTKKEEKRLEELYKYDILDTSREQEFDGLTRLASRLCNTSVSLMNLIDLRRQWTKSSHGVDITEIERSESFCQYTIEEDGVFEVENLEKDNRFKNKFYVKNSPHLRFYAGAPLTTSNGYNLGTICVMDTEPRRLDEEQRKDLKTIADEIVARLELRRQNKELQRINKQKNELMRVARHDMRNPIMGINGVADMLLSDPDIEVEERNDMLGMVKDCSDQLLSLISELLDNELLSHDQIVPSPESADPVAEAEKVIHMHRSKAESKQISLKLSSLSEIPSLKLDVNHFSRILGNLLTNAIKFTSEEGQVEVRMGYEDKDSSDEDGLLKIEVEDTGTGILEEDREHLFEKKVDGREGTNGEPSYGLGLFIVGKLVEANKGSIEVDSTVGEGCTFTCWIPCNKAVEKEGQ